MAQVEIERDGAVMIVTLNRPHRKNAMTLTMFAQLADAWVEVSENDDIRCVILTGAEGDFSSGMDLRALAGDVLAQLEELDLSQGTLVDEDVSLLVDNPQLFKHLKRLDLSENYLTDEMEERLERLYKKAFVGGSRYDEMVGDREQYGEQEWAKKATFRYAAVGE